MVVVEVEVAAAAVAVDLLPATIALPETCMEPSLPHVMDGILMIGALHRRLANARIVRILLLLIRPTAIDPTPHHNLIPLPSMRKSQ
jgi:hypothetical protein